jgi:hypothetical protein
VVGVTTLLHQLKEPWRQAITEGPYYFCAEAGCEVAYFDGAGRRFVVTGLRQPAGQKSTAADRTLCYCFDIRYSDLADSVSATRCRDFVIEATRAKRCACEQRNPSGHCCLRDFPKLEE